MIICVIIFVGVFCYFQFIPKVITITFNIGDNILNKTLKADTLLLSYTDELGKTKIISEGNNIKISCLSYHNNGCKLDKLPTINAKGYIIYGFSVSVGGDNIDILNSTFKEDVTLYAKVGYDNSNNGMEKIDISDQKLYGNVLVEVENGILENDISDLVKTLDTIYEYYPEIFYFNGKIFWLMPNTYNTVLKRSNSHANITSGCTIYSSSYHNSFFKDIHNNQEAFRTLMHEVAHSFDRSFKVHISERDDFLSLYNKYKESENRPFYNYSYTNPQEFFADATSSVVSLLIDENTNNHLYYRYSSIPSDIKAYIIKVLDEKKTDLKKINLIK